MNDYIHLTVASIVEHEKKFLMVEEFSKTQGMNVINQPAGHVENNEAILDAVIRETLEETAWLVKPESVIGIYQSFTTSNANENKSIGASLNNNKQSTTQYLRVCFSCSIISETDNELDTDILSTHWLSQQDIFSLDNARSAMVKKCLQDYLDGIRFPLEILTALR